jgi:hypothetical protein
MSARAQAPLAATAVELSHIERVLLTAVKLLGPEANSEAIFNLATKLYLPKLLDIWSMCPTLVRLEAKGLVSSWIAAPRRYYRVLPAGLASLEHMPPPSLSDLKTAREFARKVLKDGGHIRAVGLCVVAFQEDGIESGILQTCYSDTEAQVLAAELNGQCVAGDRLLAREAWNALKMFFGAGIAVWLLTLVARALLKGTW